MIEIPKNLYHHGVEINFCLATVNAVKKLFEI